MNNATNQNIHRAVGVWVPLVTRPHLHYRPHSTLMKLCENQTKPNSRLLEQGYPTI